MNNKTQIGFELSFVLLLASEIFAIQARNMHMGNVNTHPSLTGNVRNARTVFRFKPGFKGLLDMHIRVTHIFTFKGT